MDDKKIACFVFLTGGKAWNDVKMERRNKQHVFMSSNRQAGEKDIQLSSVAPGDSSDFCPASQDDCIR
jgi:hypothetical protein